MKTRKPSPAIFLRAAELQFANMKEVHDNASQYACDNIGYALIEAELDTKFNCTVEHDFFAAQFKLEAHLFDGWWPPLADGSHDHESRILALLLCAEMLKR